jgi:dTDP-glucose pyrophosphorylase
VITIVLSAGQIDYTQLPFGMHQSNATIPVNGRPVIGWIIHDLLQKGYEDLTVVIRKENIKLRNLLINHFAKKSNLKIVVLEVTGSILDSLRAGLDELESTKQSVQVILGDTLIYDNFDKAADFVFAAPVTSTEKWCIVERDEWGYIKKLIDKAKLPGNENLAVCGYYRFSDAKILKKALETCLSRGQQELSSVLIEYHATHPMKVFTAEDWFDFGHLDTMIESKKTLIRPRHFNHIHIDPIRNTLTKTSQKTEKLEDELNWYKLLPSDLQILTPRILSEAERDGKVSITQEYYGYPALSELFLYGDLSIGIWQSIIHYLFEVHQLFSSYGKADKPAWRRYIYRDKTNERIESLLSEGNFWQALWKQSEISINNIKYRNIPDVLDEINEGIENLINQGRITIIHGDYCLSNILYDLNNQIVRLIDPRGSFGEKGIYGDPRYDVAKLRHSFVGLYDMIVADMFLIERDGANFTYTLSTPQFLERIAEIFDQEAELNSYVLREIRLIEGLLFLSMIPYHRDFPDRQLMMYIRSIEKLNEWIYENCN